MSRRIGLFIPLILLPFAVVWESAEFIMKLSDMLHQDDISSRGIVMQVLDAIPVVALTALWVLCVRAWRETRQAKSEGEADKPDDKKE